MQSSPWHVLHVLSNHEDRVARSLSAREVEHYIPCYKKKAKWSDRTVVTERPLFSGYVFAHVRPQDRINVLSTPGVLRVLGNDQRDMVSNEQLCKIREGLMAGLAMQPHPSIPIGTRVRVLEGVFTGAEGVVSELRKNCKVVLSLAAVNQSFSVEIGGENLLILDTPKALPRVARTAALSI